MDYYEQELWVRLLDDWLVGATIEEKTKNYPRGKLEICIKCGEVFFDLEDPCQRRWISCYALYSKHECIELENYIILMKSYRGVFVMVTYPDSVSEIDAICEYFKNLARGKYYKMMKDYRFRF
jgi:hypothetical protein